ncbi:MAG TPA: hypothetical protein VLD63_04775, partial [Anaerolineales bacterium]|nr:hypothetical protein [Anaerolineales bacterium]
RMADYSMLTAQGPACGPLAMPEASSGGCQPTANSHQPPVPIPSKQLVEAWQESGRRKAESGKRKAESAKRKAQSAKRMTDN